jgi:hypothetical protein
LKRTSRANVPPGAKATPKLATILQMPHPSPAIMPDLTAAAVMSFLKQTRGLISWSAGNTVEALHIRNAEAKQALIVLAMQGYVKAEGSEWLTTINGETVCGSAAPRYSLESMDGALEELAARIGEVNRDRSSPFHVEQAVAFGDFLLRNSRAQAADIGIRVAARHSGKAGSVSIPENTFLRSLRGRTPLLHILPYEPWMSVRTHRSLL